MRQLLIAASVLLTACSGQPPMPSATAPEMATTAATSSAIAGDPAEGERIASRVGCRGCHGKDGRGKKLWGEPGDFQLFSPNLTERRALYDDAGVDGLLRQGRTHDGHPPFGMPVFMLEHLSDREVRDITAWLRALPAVANPDKRTSWYSEKMKQQLRDGTLAEDDHLPTPGMDPPAVPPAEPLALGQHLAMTSCTECHGRDLNGWSPDDPAPSLIVAKAYTPEQFAQLMKTGIAATGAETKSGFMSEEARDRFAILTDAEISALKAYLDAR